jgi:parvulin-like peptidyl-prolyl isomerase
MKIALSIILIPVLIYFSACSNQEENIVASVNKEEIPLSTFRKKYQKFLDKIYQKDNLLNRYAFLNSIIDEELILKYSSDQKYDQDSLYQARLKKINDQLLLNHYFEQVVNNDIIVTKNELRKYFKWQNASIHVKHIFSKSKNHINELKVRLNKGEKWDKLAKECFQDSILRLNGGDLGWYSFDELDPVFAHHAFSLKVGSTSDPVRTQDGYSIIYLNDIEYDIFLKEKDFLLNQKKLENKVKSFKQKSKLLRYTDEMANNQNILFEEKTLEDLYTFLNSVDLKDIEKLENKLLVEFQNDRWSVGMALDKLNELSNRQLSRINSTFDLKQSIIGLICRDVFIGNALTNKLNKSENFINSLKKEEEHLTIKYVLEKIEKKDDFNISDNDKENYFNFRNHLLSNSIVKIDSALIKKFIM